MGDLHIHTAPHSFESHGYEVNKPLPHAQCASDCDLFSFLLFSGKKIKGWHEFWISCFSLVPGFRIKPSHGYTLLRWAGMVPRRLGIHLCVHGIGHHGGLRSILHDKVICFSSCAAQHTGMHAQHQKNKHQQINKETCVHTQAEKGNSMAGMQGR
jgi:hypothetical protein